MMRLQLWHIFWNLGALLGVQSQRIKDDKVLHVPHFDGDICWTHHAGYLDANDDHQLFYWYHEAVESPQEKPLVLWLNGGPGCSSLGGMFTELGPFVLDANLTVTLNPYSFNKIANLLFLEQPVGVGFSYPSGVPANDTTTAEDTVAALRNFFRQFPQLQGRDFYVMGESYGGHYVPNTVQQIKITNAAARAAAADDDSSDNIIINLKGFAVGNGYTDWQLDFNANVENGRFHALTSQSLMDAAQQACQGDYARCFWPRPDVECPDDCRLAVEAATMYAEDGSIDIYDIYNDVCLEPTQKRLETQVTTLLNYRRQALLMMQQQQQEQRQLTAVISPVFPTCIDAYTEMYLNLPAVQRAIHVRPSTIPNGYWSDCGNVEYDFNYESELPKYQQWVQQQEGDLQILIYNGDADYILSHMGNSAWINQGLQLPKLLDWTKWYGSDGQVAGYYEQYQTMGRLPLTFLTVKGAGHMVPRDRPRHALDMLEQFLAGGTYDQVKQHLPVEPLCSSLRASSDPVAEK